jgi:hypothetical protein
VCDLDPDHNLQVTKSRCDLIADAHAFPHRAGEVASKFAAWLGSGAPQTQPTVDVAGPFTDADVTPERPPVHIPGTGTVADMTGTAAERKTRAPMSEAQRSAASARGATPDELKDDPKLPDAEREARKAVRHDLYALAAESWGATHQTLTPKALATYRRMAAQHVAKLVLVHRPDERTIELHDAVGAILATVKDDTPSHQPTNGSEETSS